MIPHTSTTRTTSRFDFPTKCPIIDNSAVQQSRRTPRWTHVTILIYGSLHGGRGGLIETPKHEIDRSTPQLTQKPLSTKFARKQTSLVNSVKQGRWEGGGRGVGRDHPPLPHPAKTTTAVPQPIPPPLHASTNSGLLGLMPIPHSYETISCP